MVSLSITGRTCGRSVLFSMKCSPGSGRLKGMRTQPLYTPFSTKHRRRSKLCAPNIPKDLRDVVNRLLQKDAAGRYQTAAELEADLKPIRNRLALGPLVNSPSEPERRTMSKRRSWMFLIGAVGFLGILIFALLQ